MFRKFTLAALAALVGMVAAAKLTGGKHITLSELLEPNKDRLASLAPVVQPAKSGNSSAKKPAAAPSPVAQQ